MFPRGGLGSFSRSLIPWWGASGAESSAEAALAAPLWGWRAGWTTGALIYCCNHTSAPPRPLETIKTSRGSSPCWWPRGDTTTQHGRGGWTNVNDRSWTPEVTRAHWKHISDRRCDWTPPFWQIIVWMNRWPPAPSRWPSVTHWLLTIPTSSVSRVERAANDVFNESNSFFNLIHICIDILHQFWQKKIQFNYY